MQTPAPLSDPSKTRHSPIFDSTVSRTVLQRNSLPGARAIVGALLMAISAVGAFAVSSGAIDDKTRPVVVAARDLPPGTRLETSDLRFLRMQISDDIATHAASSRTALIGKTLLGPVETGELLQDGIVAEKSSSQSEREISIGIAASRALGGNLRSGETVDVLITSKEASATNERATVVNGAKVVQAERRSNGIGQANTEITVVLAINSEAEATSIASGVDHGSVTLVRTTGIQN